MPDTREHRVVCDAELAGQRLDQALAQALPQYSRNLIQTWIKAGGVLLNGSACRVRDKITAGDQVTVTATLDASADLSPEALTFPIVHEDPACLVVDKPAGLVVHPGAGNPHGTLVNGLLHRYPELAALPRAGLIHRLDKDTTGLLLAARTNAALLILSRALAKRRITRNYAAVVHGALVAGGTVDAPIARDRHHRTRMRVQHDGRAAVTHYRIAERFPAHTHLELGLETGRTHQIRVHMQFLGHAIVGDPTYGGRYRVPAGACAALVAALSRFKRQALHARRLVFKHPSTNETITLESPLPADFRALLDALRADRLARQQNS